MYMTYKKKPTIINRVNILFDITFSHVDFKRENQNWKTFNSDVIHCKMFSFKSLHPRCKCDVQTYLLHGHFHLDFLPLSFYIEPSPALLHHCFLIYHLKVQNLQNNKIMSFNSWPFCIAHNPVIKPICTV